ncbi:hypothetical protein TNCV_2472871 [Trichonephila clavipes]|nr:hypothetical protein TNCV_2472871 [Trichonephila clavipes]
MKISRERVMLYSVEVQSSGGVEVWKVRNQNKPKCIEVDRLPVLTINISHDEFEINITPGIPQIHPLKIKTIIPNSVPGKKDDMHEKDAQGTVIVCSVMTIVAEPQHPSDLPKLKDGLRKNLTIYGSMYY